MKQQSCISKNETVRKYPDGLAMIKWKLRKTTVPYPAVLERPPREQNECTGRVRQSNMIR